MPTAAPFVIQPRLTAITLAYKNADMIADQVLPRVQVDSPDFKYTSYTKEDTFTIPDTKVGRVGKTNQIDYSASELTASVADFGLEEAVPYFDTAAAAAAIAVQGVTPVDPEARATEQISDVLALAREQRVANLVFNAASYAGANQQTLAGTSQWSDFTNGVSNPINDILTALDLMIVRANSLVLGQAVWTKLRQHPKVIQAIYGSGSAQQSGVVSREQVAQLLELKQILVGQGFVNTAKKGQAGTFSRLWGKFASLLYINPLTSTTRDMSYGVTAQWGPRVSGTIEDKDIGLRGGTRVRVGESVKELVLANDTGYLFQAAVA
jgi:hypothetical protein